MAGTMRTQWFMLFKTDFVILSRSIKLFILVPLIGIYLFVLIKYFEMKSSMFISTMLVLGFLGVFENMFTRCENEYFNYSLAAANTLAVVSAKNVSSILVFSLSFGLIILFAGILTHCSPDWLIENCNMCIISTPLLLISGNIQSERRITHGMTGVSILNGLIGTSIILTGILLYKSICAIWNIYVGLLTCGIIYYSGCFFSIWDTAQHLEKKSTSLMETN